MKGQRGAQEDRSHSVASDTACWEGICFRGERSESHFGHAERGVPVRHPSGDVKEAGSYVNLELREGRGCREKDERHSCVIISKVIYKRTN